MKIKDVIKSIIFITALFFISSCSTLTTEGELEAPQQYTRKKIIDSCKTILSENNWEICSINIAVGELSAYKPDDDMPGESSSEKLIRTINIELDVDDSGTIIYISAASSLDDWNSGVIYKWFSSELSKSLPGTKTIQGKK
jgi:hypothetical protein